MEPVDSFRFFPSWSKAISTMRYQLVMEGCGIGMLMTSIGGNMMRKNETVLWLSFRFIGVQAKRAKEPAMFTSQS